MNGTHARPDTPGYQLLLNVATDYLSEKPARNCSMMLAGNLHVRENEKIPDDHFDEVMTAVFRAIFKSNEIGGQVDFPNLAMDFFHAQMGREAFTAMAAELAPDWEVVDAKDFKCGYTLFTTDTKRMREHLEQERRNSSMKEMFGSLFGFGPDVTFISRGSVPDLFMEEVMRHSDEVPNAPEAGARADS